jgi:hypothetical protein
LQTAHHNRAHISERRIQIAIGSRRRAKRQKRSHQAFCPQQFLHHCFAFTETRNWIIADFEMAIFSLALMMTMTALPAINGKIEDHYRTFAHVRKSGTYDLNANERLLHGFAPP